MRRRGDRPDGHQRAEVADADTDTPAYDAGTGHFRAGQQASATFGQPAA
jgi:hypothetical protein